MRSWKSILHNDVGFKTLVTFHVRVRHVYVKKQRFLVWNSQKLPETQSDIGNTSVVKNEGVESVVGNDVRILEKGNELETDAGGDGGDSFDGSGGNGKYPSGGSGGGSGSGSGGNSEGEEKGEEEEFGPIMKFDEVIKEVEARGASLPSDMLEAAKSVGIRKLLLLRYLDLQVVYDFKYVVQLVGVVRSFCFCFCCCFCYSYYMCACLLIPFFFLY